MEADCGDCGPAFHLKADSDSDNPQSPEGRAGRREGLTAKARAERQCVWPLRCDPAFLLILLPPLEGFRLRFFN